MSDCDNDFTGSTTFLARMLYSAAILFVIVIHVFLTTRTHFLHIFLFHWNVNVFWRSKRVAMHSNTFLRLSLQPVQICKFSQTDTYCFEKGKKKTFPKHWLISGLEDCSLCLSQLFLELCISFMVIKISTFSILNSCTDIYNEFLNIGYNRPLELSQ